jgi:hypothetical protein
MDPVRIRYELEKALLPSSQRAAGRVRVWINIPLDVQGRERDEHALPGLRPCRRIPLRDPPRRTVDVVMRHPAAIAAPVASYPRQRRVSARRPSRRSGVVVDKLQIPVCLTIASLDLLSESHPLA